MDKFKFTPWPWVFHESIDPADFRTAYLVGIEDDFADGHNFAAISGVYTHSLINSLEARENAKLIAAAPALLEALREAREGLVLLIDYMPSDRSEFRSDSKGDRQFENSKADRTLGSEIIRRIDSALLRAGARTEPASKAVVDRARSLLDRARATEGKT